MGHGVSGSCCVSVGDCGNAVPFPQTVSGTISLDSPGIQALGTTLKFMSMYV